jgi:hypothetical protein
LREAGFGEPDNFRSLDAKEFIQLGAGIFLDDGIMGKIGENFRAAAGREVRGYEHEVEFAFATAQRVAPNQQGAGFQHEREKPLDGFGGGEVGHVGFCIGVKRLSL